MQISELLCRAEYIMRATSPSSPPPPPPSPSLTFRSPVPARPLDERRRSYLPRPPILANCTLQLISDTARAPE